MILAEMVSAQYWYQPILIQYKREIKQTVKERLKHMGEKTPKHICLLIPLNYDVVKQSY